MGCLEEAPPGFREELFGAGRSTPTDLASWASRSRLDDFGGPLLEEGGGIEIVFGAWGVGEGGGGPDRRESQMKWNFKVESRKIKVG